MDTSKLDPARLANDFPESAAVRLRLLNSQLAAGDREAAKGSIVWLKSHGHVFTPASQNALAKLITDWGEAADTLMLKVPEPVEQSRPFASVPEAAQLVEGVVVDGKTGRIFASTVVSRQLWVRSRAGKWSALDLPGADSLSGMAVDARARTLWIASGNLGMGDTPAGAFHGLIAVDLDRLLETRRIAAPAGANPSDIAIGQDGTIYASDPLGGGVYRAPAGSTELVTLIKPGTFRSPQGLAASADGTMLYLSDFGYGLAAISLKTGAISRVSQASDSLVPLDGIDGLWGVGSSFVAVQNGTSPARILRFRFGQGGTHIESITVLEQAHSAWSEPLSGSIYGNALIYVANGQWDRFDRGMSLAAKPPRATEIRILPFRTINR